VPASKSSVPSKGISSSSSKTVSTSSSGPVTEEEIRAVLMQKTPVTTQDLVANFKARLRSPEVCSFQCLYKLFFFFFSVSL
jgi:transcription initiation factor TFIIF subunit alpha